MYGKCCGPARKPGWRTSRKITAIKESIAAWTHCVRIVEAQLQRTGAWIAGERFTLADIVLGLSVHRWKMTPFAHPEMPAVERWYMALNQRPAFMRHGNNGVA